MYSPGDVPPFAAMPAQERIANLIAGLVAAWNSHDLDGAAAFFAADYEGSDVAQAEPQRGRAGIRNALARYHAGLPDVQCTLDELIVANARAVAVWTARGTHLGALLNVPPSGSSVTLRGIATFTLRDGEIIRAAYIWDVAGLLRNIGLLPEL